MRRSATLLTATCAALIAANTATAGGGHYSFSGGTPSQRAQVRAALDASAFPWSLVPEKVTIHIGPTTSHARKGHVYLDADLLSAGRFAWAVVQDEYAHQVDYYLFDPRTRTQLTRLLGAKDWCYENRGLRHEEYGCERFASTLVWSYWPSKHNAYKPTTRNDEAAAMTPNAFRALMADLIGAPRTAASARL
jgi:hypothetical protein